MNYGIMKTYGTYNMVHMIWNLKFPLSNEIFLIGKKEKLHYQFEIRSIKYFPYFIK